VFTIELRDFAATFGGAQLRPHARPSANLL
jgi:hypothetical protein